MGDQLLLHRPDTITLDNPPESHSLAAAAPYDPLEFSTSALTPPLSLPHGLRLPCRLLPHQLQPLSRTSSSNLDGDDDDHLFTPSSKRTKILNSWRELNKFMEEELTMAKSGQQTGKLQAQETPPSLATSSVTSTQDGTNSNGHGFVDYNEYNGNGSANPNKGNSGTEFEESLSIEKDGHKLNIHFKCPCGNGF